MTSKYKSIRSKTKSKSIRSKTKSIKSTSKSKKISASSILFPLAFFGSLFAGGVYLATKKPHVNEKINFKIPVPNTVDVLKNDIKGLKIKGDHEKIVYDKYIVTPRNIRIKNNTLTNYEKDKEGIKEANILKDEDINNIDKIVKNQNMINKGFIFYGPTGTGKTYLTKLICLEYDMILINVPGSIISGHPGENQLVLAAVFSVAKKIAEKGIKCMILFDEIDGILPMKSGGGSGTQTRSEGLTNAFLRYTSEEDIHTNIVIVGTTNHFNNIEPASIGRFSSVEIAEFTIPKKIDKLKTAINKFTGLEGKLEKILVDVNVIDKINEELRGRYFIINFDMYKDLGKFKYDDFFEKYKMTADDRDVTAKHIDTIMYGRGYTSYKSEKIIRDIMGADIAITQGANLYTILEKYTVIEPLDMRHMNQKLTNINNNIDKYEEIIKNKIMYNKFFGHRKNHSKKKTLKRRSLKRR